MYIKLSKEQFMDMYKADTRKSKKLTKKELSREKLEKKNYLIRKNRKLEREYPNYKEQNYNKMKIN